MEKRRGNFEVTRLKKNLANSCITIENDQERQPTMVVSGIQWLRYRRCTIGPSDARYETSAEAAETIRRWFQNQRVLFVVDYVWSSNDICQRVFAAFYLCCFVQHGKRAKPNDLHQQKPVWQFVSLRVADRSVRNARRVWDQRESNLVTPRGISEDLMTEK